MASPANCTEKRMGVMTSGPADSGISFRDDKILVVLAAAYLILAALSPSIFSLAGIPFRIDDILLLFIFYYVVVRAFQGKSLILPKPLIGFYILALVMFSSIFLYVAGTGVEKMSGFYHELFRLIKYVLVLIVFVRAGRSFKDRQRILVVFFAVSVVAVVIAVAQAFDFMGINRIITSLYRPGSVHNVLVDSAYRSIGGLRAYSTFYNPNVFALFCLIPFALSFAFVLRKVRMPLFVCLTGIFFGGILLSQSRTALLCSLFSIIVSLIILAKRSKTGRGFSLKNAALVAIIMILAVAVIGSAVGLKRLGDLTTSAGSVRVRLNVASTATKEVLDQSPYLGLSTARSFAEAALDNEYLYFFYWGGAIGLLAYLFYLVALYRFIPKTVDPLNLAVSVIVLTFVLANFTLGTFLTEKIYTFFLALYGLAVASIAVIPSRSTKVAASEPQG